MQPEHPTLLSVLEVQDESDISLGPTWGALFRPGECPSARRGASTLQPIPGTPVAMTAVMQADREGDAWRLSEGYSH